jgi:ABC-type transport system substrate-binding protein
VTRNPDYWKKDRPYLDAIEYTLIKNLYMRQHPIGTGPFKFVEFKPNERHAAKHGRDKPARIQAAAARLSDQSRLRVYADLPLPCQPARHDGQLETMDTTNWFPRVMRKDYIVGLTGAGSGPDPDQNLHLLDACDGELNYNGYCSADVDKLIERQSEEADQDKRRQLVWEIERKLAEDGARPIIFYDRRATWNARVKGLTLMVNSLFNGWRMEDVWLDQ